MSGTVGLKLKQKLPGSIATAALILTTALWTFWGVMEMYWEGWWGAWYARPAYLLPAAAFLALTLAAISWPRLGGWLLILLGSAWTAWYTSLQWSRGAELSLGYVLVAFPITGLAVVAGFLFLLESRERRRLRAQGATPPRRRARYILALAIPLLIIAGASIYWAPILIAREDDGERGARLIAGNGVTLVWAPAGPGWNWQQPWGGYPAWDDLALYGLPPVGLNEDKPGYEDQHATAIDMTTTGLCAYLDASGITLVDEPQGIWRMPTADEIVRSLGLHGQNAGCAWDGASGRAACTLTPDKETPMWMPDAAPIYYWAADEYDAAEAYYVGYNGAVNSQPKSFGNPRHGYRCVRDAP